MALTTTQVTTLNTAIGAYAFPPTYYDFVANTSVHAPNMLAVEAAIGAMLLSPNIMVAKQGLANVLYWGYAQIGFGPIRVNRFWNGVTNHQINQFQALVAAGGVPTLRQIRAIKMPEFSDVSFISKILTFLNPAEYCVLDLQLAGLSHGLGVRALHNLVYTTTIGTTHHNQAIYDEWRLECFTINRNYFGGALRVVDIERGFFHLIQTGNLAIAQNIYAAA